MNISNKSVVKYTLLFLLICIIVSMFTQKAYASELMSVKATAYCLSGTCADGSQVRDGIVAYRPQDIGKTMAMYDREMNFLGYYEIKDTGSEEIKNGNIVDVWLKSYEEAVEYGVKDVFIKIVESEG